MIFKIFYLNFRCSTATKQYYAQKPKKTFKHLNFEEQIKVGIVYIRKLRYYVSLMSDNNLSTTDKRNLENLLLCVVKNSMTYYFVLDEINKIISAQCRLPW